jgi:TonB family protein
MGVRGTVELVGTIGADGHVRSTRVVKGPPMLQKVAQDAVMQWVYKPATLNDAPVENEVRVMLTFGVGR